MWGREYISQHISAEIRKENRTELYRSYCADMLMSIAQCNGAKVEIRYADLAQLRGPEKPQKSAEEVKASMLAGLREAYRRG